MHSDFQIIVHVTKNVKYQTHANTAHRRLFYSFRSGANQLIILIWLIRVAQKLVVSNNLNVIDKIWISFFLKIKAEYYIC